MEQLFYSTGQVARQLGITLATVRLLCENGVIAAETTPGGQWRVPASEVERLERDGLPPIPRPLPIESAPPAMNGTAEHNGPSESPPKPSAQVLSAEDLVAITRSLLEKRRIEREIEENEDWFRERRRQQAAAEAVERQRTEAKLAEQRRRQWMQQWTQYALNSVPYRARGEVEIEVHTAVDAALSKLQSCEPDSITRPLVDAAVNRALRCGMEGRPPTRPHRALPRKEYEFDGGYAERRREAERLRPLIREGLIDELLENPDMSYDEIRESIEDQVDERI